MTLMKTLLLCLSMASAYGVYRLPPRYLPSSKYPLTALCLLLPVALFVWPGLRSSIVTAGAAVFLAFYSVAILLVTTEENGREIHKEVLGISVLYGVSCLNLFLTGHPEFILPFSVAVLLFLFIIDRVKIMSFVAGYALTSMIFLAYRGVPILGSGLALHDAERYALLACAFSLFVITFIAFLKRSDFVSVLGFFGLLYVSIDLLLSVGLRLKGIVLYQPFLVLFVMGPLAGMIMKGGKVRP
jgi:hypothetical protein